MGESVLGPTGLTWALEQSDTRNAQAKSHRPSGREHWRARFNLVGPLGANQNWLSADIPHAVVGRWYESFAAGTAQCLTGSTTR